MNAVIVGGGIGGLATAIRLAAEGTKVVLLEKNPELGGKVSVFRQEGFTWDMGPSLVTMPDVLRDIFACAGRRLEDYLTLVPVHPTCRYFWRDGTVIDEDEAFFQRPDVQAFMKYAEGIYQLSGEAYLNFPPSAFYKAFKPSHLPLLHHLPKVMTFKTVSEVVDKHFKDPHLRQLFNRFATYNGSDPYQAPATFNIIPYVEYKFGGWYVKGGLRRIAVALTKLAAELGVDIRRGCPVTDIGFDGVRYFSGGRTVNVEADAIVANCDVMYAHRHLLRIAGAQNLSDKLEDEELSCSGYVLFLGVNKRYEKLSHHNIFFSSNYPQEFQAIFDDVQLPDDPTVYVAITSREDPEMAPAGCENWFVLINSPTAQFTRDEVFLQETYPERIIRKLESMGVENLSQHIVTKSVFTAYDFKKRDNATEGSLYGWASHSPMTSLFRPRMKSKLMDNLYFVGGTTHPGGGIPLVLLSAKMVSRMVLANHG